MNNARRGLPLARSHVEQIFPKLTSVQIRRIAARGRMRTMERGEVLVEQGDSAVPFFVVVSGELEIVRPRAQLRPLSPSMAQVSSLARSTRCLAAGLSRTCH
jgi:thioredoxin reductase (NADPH)